MALENRIVPCKSRDYYCFYHNGRHYHIIFHDWRDWTVYELTPSAIQVDKHVPVDEIVLAHWWCQNRSEQIEKLLIDRNKQVVHIAFEALVSTDPDRLVRLYIRYLTQLVSCENNSFEPLVFQLLQRLPRCPIRTPCDYYELARLSMHLTRSHYRAAVWLGLAYQSYEVIERAFKYLFEHCSEREYRFIAPVYAFIANWVAHGESDRWLAQLEPYLPPSYCLFPTRRFAKLLD